MADAIVATMFREAQARAGVPDLEELHEKRRALITANARLLASQSPKNVYDGRRKILTSVALLRIKNELDAKGEKYTAPVLEAMANVDPTVQRFIDQWETDGAMIAVVENQIREIDDLIYRGNLVMRQYASEPK